MLRYALAAALLATSAAAAIAQQTPMPATHDEVRFEARPDASSARSWASDGQTTVINLLTEAEMEALGFGFADSVMENGMIYAHVPVWFSTGPEATDTVAHILTQTDGPVVVMCAGAVRASHIHAAARIRAGEITRDELDEAYPGREWNEGWLNRLLGETPEAESTQ
ncbi:hypothetical protein AB6B38_02270 [Glycocaulis abyssi]|uniref:Rhodanese domain-containing protein n=1 Tax=Glycocaulis abyssi TaxID=1433403 RepID=A0ABV9NC68_9PROT